MTEHNLGQVAHNTYQPPRVMGVLTDSCRGVGDRIAMIERALRAVELSSLDFATRAAAQRAAHKIVAIAAAAGLWDETELAREMEAAFDGDEPIAPAMIARLTSIVATLHTALVTKA